MFNPLKKFGTLTKTRMRNILIDTYTAYLKRSPDKLTKDIITKLIEAIKIDDDVLFYRLKGDLAVRESELREQLQRKVT
jgi:uncharacterized membrane protein